MTYNMPSYMQPLLQFYSLKWPDIDEDQVKEVGDGINELSDALRKFAVALEGVLDALSEEANAEALRAMSEFWSDFTAGPVLQVTDAVGDGAKTVCDVAHDGILLYKGGITTALGIHCATDIALIISGVGIPLAVAKKVAMRQVLEAVMDEVSRQFADYVRTQFNNFFDDLVFGPIEDFANKVRTEVVETASDVIALSVPMQAGATGAAALYIDHDQVIHAVGELKSAYTDLSAALTTVGSWLKSKDLAAPKAAAPDSQVRDVLRESIDWAVDELVKLLNDIAAMTLDKIGQTIKGIYDKYIEADSSLTGYAQQLSSTFTVVVPTGPFVIDRSTRPKPIHILDAPPRVITGEGVSDARLGIIVIDLPDAPDPVVTGPGESDARLNIRQILLSEAPEPVITGLGESDARDNIRKIDLPQAPSKS